MQIKCARCDKELENLHIYQPVDGTAFSSCGNYGSTKFDPLDGTMAYLAICDDCFDSANIHIPETTP